MTAAGLVPDEVAKPRWRKGREGLGPRSLTARLVVFVVALVIVLVTAIGAGTYVALRSFLLGRLDQQLKSAAGQNASYFQRCFGNEGLDSSNGINCFPHPGPPQTQQEWVTFIAPDGTQLLQLRSTPGDPYEALKLDPSVLQPLASPGDNSIVVSYQGEGLMLRASFIQQDFFPTNMYVVTGLSTDEVRKTLRQLVILELLIGGAAVAVALVATSYGVRFSLRRLRQVTTTANEVAAELSPTGAGLDRRVEVEDDTTEVGQLAESMNTLLAAVETQFAARLESEARLRQFLADASHELRTPLTSIRGYAELARMQRAAGESAEDNLARIESEGTRMSRLVEDLLTLARGDKGGEPIRELIDVGEVVDDVLSDTRVAFADRRVEVEAASGLHVIGDRDQLLRAVRNLVTNAAVHTAPERPILVRCARHENDVVVQVIDGGPGLSPEDAAHVFERFWRADKARTRARGGSGLGLAIVATIVAGIGGSVRFDSSVEHGSTVTITLPAVSG